MSPVQIVRNVYITAAPCCLSQCSSLREASLRLTVSPGQNGEILAQLPASLESLTVNISEGNFPVRNNFAMTCQCCSPVVVHLPVMELSDGANLYIGALTVALCQRHS